MNENLFLKYKFLFIGVIPLEGGSSPLLYGDCECRAATDVEWASERWDGGELLNETVRAAQLNRTAGPGVFVKLTFWSSTPCAYHKKKLWCALSNSTP
jgi:hypothetical protein